VADLRARLQAAVGTAYHLDQELGGGGMSRVFAATDTTLGRRIVLKVLPPDLAAGVNRDRFLREIQLAASLQHPHIVPLLSAGFEDDLAYYTMPLIEGESLRAKLSRGGELPVPAVVRVLRDVVDALTYAHAHGIVHRDIKPDNVLLSGHHALVTDFGVAKAISDATGASSLTSAGVALGTPAYMAPEQVAADPHTDQRCDLYAVGALGYELLTGHPPFTGATPQQVFAAQVTRTPERVTLHRPAVPPTLEDLIMRCLEKSPADRWQSAEELLTHLETMPTPGGVPALKRTRPIVLLQQVARRPVRAPAVGAVLVALAAIITVWHPWQRPARAAAPVADVASVAVLPFDNLTGNASDRYLSDGMTEEVIGQLAQVRGLKVISRTSTEALKGTHLTLRQIADTLGVRHILEGSVRHAGNRIRVAVDLIDATTDAHVWASAYDRDLTDVFAVQEEIARQVADSLVRTVGVRPTVGHVVRTEHPGAYGAYLAGRSLMYRRTPEALRAALQQFQQAIAQDSAYAPAYAGLAAVYQLWAVYNYSGIDLYEAYGRALAMADRAIALDSDLAEAYGARGLTMTRAWAPAEEIAIDFKRALELRPNSPDAHQWYAGFLARQGHYDEALAEVERAAALDPLAPGVRTGLSFVALAARRYDVVAEEATRALALEPSLMLAREHQALGNLLSGHADRCATLALGSYLGVRAMCLHSLGRLQEAAQIVDSLRAAFKVGTVGDSIFSPAITARGIAEYFAWTGNAEESLAWLKRAYAVSPVGEEFHFIASGIYDKVRNEPRFKAGLQQARTQIYERVQRARLGAAQK
jgi:TolB-like protein/tetratricopeptide (TPR) repeat protein